MHALACTVHARSCNFACECHGIAQVHATMRASWKIPVHTYQVRRGLRRGLCSWRTFFSRFPRSSSSAARDDGVLSSLPFLTKRCKHGAKCYIDETRPDQHNWRSVTGPRHKRNRDISVICDLTMMVITDPAYILDKAEMSISCTGYFFVEPWLEQAMLIFNIKMKSTMWQFIVIWPQPLIWIGLICWFDCVAMWLPNLDFRAFFLFPSIFLSFQRIHCLPIW